MLKKGIVVLHVLCLLKIITFLNSCAVMVPPLGGAKDSIAPVLLKSNPAQKALNVTNKNIELNFDEFVTTEDVNSKIWITPAQNIQPEIKHKLKTVTIKFKDSLLPNTTYKISIYGAVKDVNEGNKLDNFDLVFSTGNTIDSNTIQGTVKIAESAKIDSSLIVGLYTNFNDSAVFKEKPKYIAKLNGNGAFTFTNLPNAKFAIYAMSDESGQKKYTSLAQQFAFADSTINTANNPKNINLYAYVQEKDKPKPPIERTTTDTKIRVSNNLEVGKLDVLKTLILTASKKLSTINNASFQLTDSTGNKAFEPKLELDSNKKDIKILYNWQMGEKYRLVLNNDAFVDEKGNKLSKNDTLFFITKSAIEYGKVTIRFNDVNFAKNPVLQIIQGENIVKSIAIKTLKIQIPIMQPGDYDLRILYDTNKNLIWDAGSFFLKKQQPELTMPLSKKLTIKPNWDNELEIDDKF
jgi:uncharacterized protein (DUF2141 family)